MDSKIVNNEPKNSYSEVPELHIIDDEEDLPAIIINTVLPSDVNQNALAGNVPLFIKKLWKMVNDNEEEIISWNSNGNGFIIHDQLQFVSHTLPKYFKHNHLSSFVRQLNLYDFHKIQNVEKEEFQFSHPCFFKDVPQLLSLIKRKPTSGKQKSSTVNSSESSTELHDVMNAVQDIKSKNDGITNDLSKLRRENAALWSEMTSLRLKYSKQTKIINKLIHFLISYMQKHHNARKTGRTVSTNNSNKYIKTGPKIMELDYRYKNNPHEFWNEFDNHTKSNEHGEQEAYTVVEPTDGDMEVEKQMQTSENRPQNISLSSAIEELLPVSSAFNQGSGSSIDPALPQIDYAASRPSSSKRSNSALQRAGGSKDKLGYFIDNTQVELNTIKELLKNLTPEEMSNFYKLVNDNYKNQEDDVPLNVGPEAEGVENELISLAQMSPLNTSFVEQDLTLPFTIENEQDLPMSFDTNEVQDVTMPFEINDNLQDLVTSLQTNESLNIPNLDTDQNAFSIPQEEIKDDLLKNISVDEFFN